MTTSAEQAVRAEVRAWLDEHWSPDLTVRAWWRLLAESGWGHPQWPVEWFGKGFDSDLAQAVRRELVAAGALAPPHGIGQTMAAPVLIEYGTEDQKQRYLPTIATGEESWCQFFSEPDAGSDLASLKTRAVRDGDEWVVNGQKVWNSGTLTADRGLLPLRTNPDVPKHRGLSFFVIDVVQPGVEVRPIRQLNGDAHFNETFFTDARVRDDDLVGGLDNGWAITVATLANERLAYAAGADFQLSVSPGERGGMLDLTAAAAAARMAEEYRAHTAFPLGNAAALIDLARERGRLDDPVLRQRIMALHCLSEATRLTAVRAKAAAEAGKAPGPESSILHVAGVHMARATRDLGLAILGPGGMLQGDDAPRQGAVAMMALTSLVHGIQGGTEQIQRNIIGERSLGLPKEPQVDRDVPFSRVQAST